MDKISQALLVKALDGLVLRQQYTAQNIANANTQNYRAVEVKFEEALQAAASKNNVNSVEAVRPQALYVTSSSSQSGVRLDLELATASQTAMRYSALIEILGRQMALNRAIIAANGR